MYAIDYTCRHWVGKADPNGIGKCSHVLSTFDEAERKAEQLRKKGSGSVKIRAIEDLQQA